MQTEPAVNGTSQRMPPLRSGIAARGRGAGKHTACERAWGTNRAVEIFSLDKQRMEVEGSCATVTEYGVVLLFLAHSCVL